MDLTDVTASVHRHWRVSVAILLLTLAAIGIFLVTRNEVRGEDRWSTTVQLLVPVREDGVVPEGVPPQLLQGQAAVAYAEETTSAALSGAGLDESARRDVTFGFSSPDPQAVEDENARPDILRLTVTAPEATESTALARSYANAYIAARRAIVTERDDATRESSRGALESLQSRLDQVDNDLRAVDPALLALLASTDSVSEDADGEPRGPISLPPGTPIETQLLVYERRALMNRITSAQEAYAASSIHSIVPEGFATVVERSTPDQVTPELPSPLIPIGVGLAAGLALAVAVPVLIDRFDRTIRDSRSAAGALSATVLATIPSPSKAELTALAKPGSPSDGAYQALAATSVATDKLPRAVVVTAPVGHMQDFVAPNFAVALASLGLRVALVVTDPSQAWFVGPTSASGATTLPDLLHLARAGTLDGQIQASLLPTRHENLAVLAPGTTSADALFDGLAVLLRGLAAEEIDVTVIAGPALLDNPSASILAWSTRSVLWAIEAGAVTDHEAREAASRLELTGAAPFGVVVVAAKG